jgi:hypothetical protein
MLEEILEALELAAPICPIAADMLGGDEEDAP